MTLVQTVAWTPREAKPVRLRVALLLLAGTGLAAVGTALVWHWAWGSAGASVAPAGVATDEVPRWVYELDSVPPPM